MALNNNVNEKWVAAIENVNECRFQCNQNRTQMATEAAIKLSHYCTVNPNASPDKTSGCDLGLSHASAELWRLCRTDSNGSKTVSGVCCLLRSVHASDAALTRKTLRGLLLCTNQSLKIFSDCVLNKTCCCFFYVIWASSWSDHTWMLYIELFIIKDCTSFFFFNQHICTNEKWAERTEHMFKNFERLKQMGKISKGEWSK